MAEGKQKIQLSQEELDRIYALPERVFCVGGMEVSGKYDEYGERFYLLKLDGTLSGKTAIVRKSDAMPDGPESAAITDDENVKPQFIDDEDEDERPENDLKKKKFIFVICCVFAVIAAVMIFVVRPLLFGDEMPTETQDSPTLGPTAMVTPRTSGEPVVQQPEPETIQVVRVLEDLIPGDIITAEVIDCTAVSQETYNLITLGGTGLYQSRSYESLLGQHVTAYIPAGQLLAYAHVAVAYSSPSSPWMSGGTGEDMAYITIPLRDNIAGDAFNYGMNVVRGVYPLEMKPYPLILKIFVAFLRFIGYTTIKVFCGWLSIACCSRRYWGGHFFICLLHLAHPRESGNHRISV